jgi:BlaI family penicillinase repressor
MRLQHSARNKKYKNILTSFTNVNSISFTIVNDRQRDFMEKLPKISEAEYRVMKIIWDRNPVTSMEIIKKLKNTTDWKPYTIKTLVNRLLTKEAIGFEKSGREYSYYPLIDEADYVKAESRSFLKRLFGGSLVPMLATMVENDDLTLADVEILKKRIMEKKKGN